MTPWRTFFLMSVLLISGCSDYDPPAAGDHTAAKYKTDLEACRTSSHHAVYLKNAGSPGTWMISPFTGPPEVRAAMRICMQGKGYVLQNGGG